MLQLAVCLLLLLRRDHATRLAATLAIGFHLATAATMSLGIFPWVMIAAWWAIWPTQEDAPAAARPPQWTCALLTVAILWMSCSAFAWGMGWLTRDPAWALGLNQSWRMYAGEDYRQGRYHVALGVTAQGEMHDLFANRPIPSPSSARSERVLPEVWRSWVVHLSQAPERQRSYARWLCREDLTHVELYEVRAVVPPPGEPDVPATATLMMRWPCHRLE